MLTQESNIVKSVGKLPSEIVQTALDALIEAEKPNSPVKPNMALFHFVNAAGVCFACLGGLAGIREFGLNPKEAASGIRVNKTVRLYEWALDDVRIGDIASAFTYWYDSPQSGEQFNRQMSDYEYDPSGFKEDLRQLIEDLKNNGY